MRVLTTAAGIGEERVRLIRGCSSCRIAVAWASTGFAAFEALVRHRKKIKRMVVGILHNATALMDAALNRLAPAREASAGTGPPTVPSEPT